MITVIPYKKPSDLGEIYQSMQLKMGLLRRKEKDTFEQITPFIKCRDFLCDVHSSALAKKDFAIYGMQWKGSTDPVDWDAVRLILRFPSEDVKAQWWYNVLLILHTIEASNNILLSQQIWQKNEDVFIEGNKFWLENALKFSLYTFLLRVMCYKLDVESWVEDFCKMGHTDSSYLKSIDRDTLNRVLTDLKLLDTKEWCGLSWSKHRVSDIHHNSGFISVFGKHSEIHFGTVKQNLHYQAMKDKGLTMYV